MYIYPYICIFVLCPFCKYFKSQLYISVSYTIYLYLVTSVRYYIFFFRPDIFNGGDSGPFHYIKVKNNPLINNQNIMLLMVQMPMQCIRDIKLKIWQKFCTIQLFGLYNYIFDFIIKPKTICMYTFIRKKINTIYIFIFIILKQTYIGVNLNKQIVINNKNKTNIHMAILYI